uniref:ATP synthase FO subunit 8 n=1 Tax=Parevania sp. SJW-2015 TaxID=1725431 RepID=A0A384S521_9HYME|nr:ATP synthase FO subunit 8 [Parevania sp. SJW-2015]
MPMMMPMEWMIVLSSIIFVIILLMIFVSFMNLDYSFSFKSINTPQIIQSWEKK